MDVLITGASGFLGGCFYRILEKEHNVAGTYYETPKRKHHQLDITHRDRVISFVQELEPDVIIHTAAIADPDRCYRDEESALNINHRGTSHVATAAKRVGAKVVYISTSFVFPGAGTYGPDDEPNPGTIYSHSKLKGERAVQDTLEDYVILRCPKLFGVDDSDETSEITASILHALTQHGAIELDNETVRYPVFADNVVAATERLLEVDATGTYHISTHTPYTKHEFGELVSDIFDVDGNVVPVTGEKLVERPSGIELDTTKLERIGVDITPVDVALDVIKHQRACSFKTIYSFKPDELIKGKSASKIRADLGKELGRDDQIDADIVVPIPESGIYPATGYADATGTPLYHGIIRDYETDRTLYEPNIKDRTRKLRKKLVAVDDMLQGQRVVLVDEAIISGLTIATAIDKCQNVGVEEIHVRIPSPPMRDQCAYGILDDDATLAVPEGLTDHDGIQEHLEQRLNLDSIRFLDRSTFEELIPSDYNYVCTSCFKSGESA